MSETPAPPPVMVFSCPRCGQILTGLHFKPGASDAEQLKVTGAIVLQRHLTEHHPDICAQIANLIGQYSLACMVKCFATTDPRALAQREELYRACIATISEPWEVSLIEQPAADVRPAKLKSIQL
jgi:hypothetical protein